MSTIKLSSAVVGSKDVEVHPTASTSAVKTKKKRSSTAEGVLSSHNAIVHVEEVLREISSPSSSSNTLEHQDSIVQLKLKHEWLSKDFAARLEAIS